MQLLESLVDVVELHLVSDKLVDRDLPALPLLHELRHRRPGLVASEGRAHPLLACHEVERPGGDLLPSACHADDDTLAPPAVGAFEGCTHCVGQADRLERVVDAEPCRRQTDQHLLDRLVRVVLGVNAVGGAKLLGDVELGGVCVDGEDALRPRHLAPVHHRQTHGPQPEHCTGGAFLDLGGVERGAQASRDAAAEEACDGEVCGLVDLSQRNLRHHDVLAEARTAHKVRQRFPLHGFVPRRPIRHHPLALRSSDLEAQVALGRLAEEAVSALGCVQRNDMVPNSKARNSISDAFNHSAALVAEDGGKQPLRIGP
mmetsp:Transcript_40033/g.80236  ORF Transcript_40033/g.80236 Transcript_40033/m.80236 type:complete len:315 (+) Transcript_40033:175-1119(+)